MKASFDNQVTLNESIRRKVHALQTMAQNIVHETNNYYGILQGYLSMLEMKSEDDENLRKFLPPMKEALQSGIDLNKRLAEFYRLGQEMITDVDLAAAAREVCATFARDQEFTVDVIVSGELKPVPLNEAAIRSLVGDLCLLAKETGTSPAQLELAPAELEEAAIAAMVLESRPGPYLRLRITISLADYPQEEETEFLNPFALEQDYSSGLGLALLHNTLQNHGGNLDVASQDKYITLNLYFPQ